MGNVQSRSKVSRAKVSRPKSEYLVIFHGIQSTHELSDEYLIGPEPEELPSEADIAFLTSDEALKAPEEELEEEQCFLWPYSYDHVGARQNTKGYSPLQLRRPELYAEYWAGKNKSQK